MVVGMEFRSSGLAISAAQHVGLEACLTLSRSVEGEFRGVGKKGQACVQLARILQYLECPQ